MQKHSPLVRARNAVSYGERWQGCYWRMAFRYDGREVLVASIPAYLLSELERGRTNMDRVCRNLARASLPNSGATEVEERAYYDLWEEAVTYALGCREDARQAKIHGLAALKLIELHRWVDAFELVYKAFELENNYGQGRFWGKLLYVAAEELHAQRRTDFHPFLQRYAECAPVRRRRRRKRR